MNNFSEEVSFSSGNTTDSGSDDESIGSIGSNTSLMDQDFIVS